jgi:hypothetical protein
MLVLLAGSVAILFPVFNHRMHRPPGQEEEARFFKEIAPHWQPSYIKANSVIIDRDEGAMYGELKASEPFKGIRMIPLDKESTVWRYDLNGKSYAVKLYWPHNASWILRSIQSKMEAK